MSQIQGAHQRRHVTKWWNSYEFELWNDRGLAARKLTELMRISIGATITRQNHSSKVAKRFLQGKKGTTF